MDVRSTKIDRNWFLDGSYLSLQPESDDDIQMKTLNRFALIVCPSGPYIEWAAKAFGEPEADARRELGDIEPSVYLLPESDAADLDHPTVLKAHWRAIFKEELEGWCKDEKTWPKNRTEALFRAWFTLDLCTLVYDLGKKPIVLED